MGMDLAKEVWNDFTLVVSSARVCLKVQVTVLKVKK